VEPGASEEDVQRAYRRRVIERHRNGVFRIVDQLRRAQRALVALSTPVSREAQLRDRRLRESLGVNDRATARDRQLALLSRYKERMSRDLERIGAANAAHHAPELAEIERQIESEEADSRRLARRRRLAGVVRSALWFALALAIAVALWVRLHGT
jgi:hypothetical protein